MVAPRLKRQKQKTGEFEASLGYMLKLSQNEKQNRGKEKKMNPPKVNPGGKPEESCVISEVLLLAQID